MSQVEELTSPTATQTRATQTTGGQAVEISIDGEGCKFRRDNQAGTERRWGMAKAVEFREFTPRNSRDDLIRRVEQAPAEHAEALLATWDLLERMHEKGVY